MTEVCMLYYMKHNIFTDTSDRGVHVILYET